MSLLLTTVASSLVCRGCGTAVAADEPYPFRCPRAGDGGDHVLRRVLGPDVTFPSARARGGQPFADFRSLLHSYHLAVAGGMGDGEYLAVVHELDRAVGDVDGHGFRPTPFTAQPMLAAAGDFGQLMVKDETGNVAGSHKARHLFGLLVHLEVVERLGLAPTGDRPPLAIASCGNAALAAAVVAAAGKRRLLVFVPTDADPAVVRRLEDLGAEVTACPRAEGVAGDPTYHRMQAAIADGALPFTCQGNENGLAIEGGETLGYEMALDLAAAGAGLDHLVVQVGGGALATAVADALAEAARFGVLDRLPRLHTIQTESAWPLKRAYDRVSARLSSGSRGDVAAALAEAATHRRDYMWPWETVPHSIAHGILDDETYDWLAVVGAMLATGGEAVVAGEDELAEANELASETTAIPVDPTGSAGLAGALLLRRQGVIGPDDRVAVLFTGVRR